MAQFLGDIAFILESMLLVSGFVIFYFALEKQSKLLKFAAIVAVLIGLLGMICTGYYWFSYQSQGAFETAYPQVAIDT